MMIGVIAILVLFIVPILMAMLVVAPFSKGGNTNSKEIAHTIMRGQSRTGKRYGGCRAFMSICGGRKKSHKRRGGVMCGPGGVPPRGKKFRMT